MGPSHALRSWWHPVARLALICSALHGIGCLDRESLDNDRGRSPDAALEPNPATEEPGTDAAAPEPPPEPSSDRIAGTADAAGCSSYQPAGDGMCAGYYCGVSEQTLASALSPDAHCTADAAYVCEGSLVEVVGACTRTAKGTMPLAPDAELAEAIATCANEDARVQQVPRDCLGCFIDVALCAASNCLVPCLSGNNAECDTCQRDNNCPQPVFACTGLPSPF